MLCHGIITQIKEAIKMSETFLSKNQNKFQQSNKETEQKIIELCLMMLCDKSQALLENTNER